MAGITFNATYYYEQKLNQLKELDAEQYGDWSIADVALAFADNGLTAEQHAAGYAAVEGLDVSPDFDTSNYLEAKLAQLQDLDAETYGDWTVEDVAQAFQDAGLSPLDHYNHYGIDEGLTARPAGSSSASGLTEALGTYQGTLTARTDYLNDNANNALIEAQVDALELDDEETPTTEQVEQAIADADAAADDAVVSAENDLLDAEAELAGARAQSTSQKGVDAEVVTALDTFADNGTTRLSDANLNATESEAQANVDADEGIYAVNGTPLAADTVELEAVYSADVDGDDVADTYITSDFAGVAQETSVEFTGGVSPQNGDVRSVTVTLDGDSAVYESTYTPFWWWGGYWSGFALADGETAVTGITVDANGAATGPAGEAFTVEVDTTVDGGIATSINNVEAFNTADFIAANDPVGFAAPNDVENGAVAEADVLEDGEIYSAAELQQAIVDAETAVEEFEATNGDNAALLNAVRASINAHLGAGGDNVVVGDTDLLAIRDDIADIFDVAEGEDVDQAAVNDEVLALAGVDFAFEAAEGATLTTQQQAVNDAFADTEERVELDQAVVDTKAAFEVPEVGSVLTAVLALQEERDGQIAAVATAETALSDAEALAAETQALVDQLEGLDADIEAALATLQDSEEEGGFGVTLTEFANGSDASNESDLYVFADEAGSTITIDNFGAEGEDRLFFGEGYTLVELDEGQTINNRVGSSSELEIFWEQSEDSLNLFVEADAEAGRDLSDAAITTIALSDVNAEDIDFTAGIFSAGTVEAA